MERGEGLMLATAKEETEDRSYAGGVCMTDSDVRMG